MSSSDGGDEELEAVVEQAAGYAKAGLVAILAVALVFAAFGAFYTVEDGERGVHTRFGEVQGVSDPGLHLKVPFIDDVHHYEVRTRAYTMSSSAGDGGKLQDDAIESLTEEGLSVRIDMTTRYHVEPGTVDQIYQTVGTDNGAVLERIVRPTARESVRTCSARFPVEGIYSDQRDDFGECVRGEVRDDFTEKGIALETVQIRNIMLPDKVRQAIQDKQSTQEQIEQKEAELEVEELEKQRRIIEAQGIAESQAIIDETLTREYLRYLWIQEGLEKGDAMYVPIGNDGLPIYKDVDAVNSTGGGNSTGNVSVDFDMDDYTNRTANATAGGG